MQLKNLASCFIFFFLMLNTFSQVKPTLQTVVSLSKLYIKDGEKRLKDNDKETVRQMKIWLNTIKTGTPSKLRENINDLVNKLTSALVDNKSTNGLTVASAYLIQYDSTNLRVLNLFGAVLHTTFRIKDAAGVFEYMYTVDSSVRTTLSLANIYLDLEEDARSKKLLDKLVRLERMLKLDAGDTRDLYKTLAVYRDKKGNMREFQDALLKSSSFEGFVQHKNDEADKAVDVNEIKQGESLAQMEDKLAKLQGSTPLNGTTLLEEDYPQVAQEIDKKLGQLKIEDKMQIGLFPVMKSNSNKDYVENFPIVAEWITVFTQKYGAYVQQDVKSKTGIDTSDSKAVIQKKGAAYAKKEMAKSMQGMEDAMKFLKNANLKGVNKSQINEAMSQIKTVSKQYGVKVKDNEVDMNEIPTFDSGTPFAKENYRRYFITSKSYENYFRKYFEKYNAEVADILKVYQQKMLAEAQFAGSNMEAIEKKFKQDMNGPVYEVAKKREILRSKIAVNAIGDTYYKSWANLYIAPFDQKLKPTLEAYWNVCALYIKNMNNVDVAIREYDRVKSIYINHALAAINGAIMGASFAYFGTTEDEEAALAAAIEAAKADAVAKIPDFQKEFKVHVLQKYPERKDDFMEWMEKNWVFEISGQFLSFKVTCRTIEFEAWVFGPSASAKIDLVDATLETSTSLAWKAKAPIKIFGRQIGEAEVKVEGARRTAKFDFANGKYEETVNESVKMEAKASFGPISGSSEYEVNMDNLQSKYTGKVSVNAGDVFGSSSSSGSKAGQVMKNAFKDMSLSLQAEVSPPGKN